MENFIQNPHLDGSTFTLQGTKDSCVILIHGFTATTVEVRPIAEFLNTEGGFHIHAPLLPGHGTTPQDLNKQTWQSWYKTVEKSYYEAKYQFKNIFIAGESMGGVLACLLSSKHPEIKKIVLYSPAIKVDHLRFSSFIRIFKDYIPKTTGSNKKKKEDFPWQGYRVNPTAGAYQLYKLQKYTRRKLSSITQPVLLFQGKLDKTISHTSSYIIFRAVNSTTKELVFLKNSGHTIILDNEFEFVAKKTLAFLRL